MGDSSVFPRYTNRGGSGLTLLAVPAYTMTEPAVAAFVLIPVVLFAIFVRGIVAAWQRGGASPAAARRAGAIIARALLR